MLKKQESHSAPMISAVTGEPVGGTLDESHRRRRSTLASWIGHGFFLLLLWFLPSALSPPQPLPDVQLPHLIFVAEPGPGGGGGGGGELNSDRPSIQKITGEDLARLALKVETPEERLIFEEPNEPITEETEEESLEEEPDLENPEIKAPIVAQAPDDFDQKGLLEGLEQLMESAGPGENGGGGSGSGNGIGPGEGPGLGPGWGGGFGGGAYRMGSGVTPPTIKRQVQPGYTDHALARKIVGIGGFRLKVTGRVPNQDPSNKV